MAQDLKADVKIYVFTWRDSSDIPFYERTVSEERTAVLRIDETGRPGFYFINHIPLGFRYWY